MKRRLSLFTSLFGLLFNPLAVYADAKSDYEKLRIETEDALARAVKQATLYELPPGEDLYEITDKILKHELVSEEQKELIASSGRRMFLFTYPSDGLHIKGVISFIPDPENHPLLVVLRGGNKTFGVINPGGKIMTPEYYSVITTTYRDGFSEGKDEFGGADVDDVKNLIDFIPTLEERLNHKFQNQNKYLLGLSRGGMEMFLALSRFPELQTYFNKAISLSGMLDMRDWIMSREDIKQMFIDSFGLIEGENEELWINERDPLLAAEYINHDLPILIIQGKDDLRVRLEIGYHMVEKLQSQGNKAEYLEFDNADHCLYNLEFMDIILDLLKE